MLEIAVETVLVIRGPRSQRPAPAEVKLTPHHRQRTPDAPAVGKRPKIHAAVVLAQAGQCEARNRIVEIDLEQEEAFVVAEIDVEARLKILDEPPFEQERLRLVLHHMPVEVVDGVDQRVELEIPSHPTRGVEVLADPFAQVPRLAHVDDRAKAVLVQVDPGTMGNLRELIANMIRDGHRMAR